MVIRFTEIVGTSGKDNWTGTSENFYFGLAGDDYFRGGYSAGQQVFIGGSGNDTYVVDQQSTVTVFENGSSSNDKLIVTGLGPYRPNTYFLTLDNKHLVVLDTDSYQEIYIFNWNNPSSRIETIVAEGVSYTYDEISTFLSISPNNLGNYTFENFNSTFQVKPAWSTSEYREAITYLTNKNYQLENPNQAPTDISLDNLSVAENSAGVHVANITGTDPEGDVLTYSIVGGADAALFEISASGDMLHLVNGVSADYEADSQLEVQLQATDPDGLTYQEMFTIAVTDVNETPTDIALSSLNNVTLDLWRDDADTGEDLVISNGEVGINQAHTFDEIKLSTTEAYSPDITIGDAIDILRHIVGIKSLDPTSNQFHAADVNNDGEVEIGDAIDVLRHIVDIKRIDTFDLIDDKGARITQLDANSSDGIPEWTLVANGDVDLSGSFSEDYLVAVEVV